MKVVVLQQFRDKVTGAIHPVKAEIELSEERARALAERSIVSVIEDEAEHTLVAPKKGRKPRAND